MSVEREFDAHDKHINESGQDVDSFRAPDITAEEFAEHVANLFANALTATKLFEVVEVKAGVGQVHVLGRVKNDKERIFMEKVGNPLLDVIMDHSELCTGFLGKQMLRKKLSHNNRVTRFAWVISYASNDIKEATSLMCRAFESAAPKIVVTEAPLMGPGTPQSGGQRTGRKGASPVL